MHVIALHEEFKLQITNYWFNKLNWGFDSMIKLKELKKLCRICYLHCSNISKQHWNFWWFLRIMDKKFITSGGKGWNSFYFQVTKFNFSKSRDWNFRRFVNTVTVTLLLRQISCAGQCSRLPKHSFWCSCVPILAQLNLIQKYYVTSSVVSNISIILTETGAAGLMIFYIFFLLI